jgi:hypothetical protein
VDKTIEAPVSASVQAPAPIPIDPSIFQKPKEVKTICEVCGHANPEFVSICQMCSNYLKGMRER